MRRSAAATTALLLVAAACGDVEPLPLPDTAGATYRFPALDSAAITMVEGQGESPDGVRAGATDWALLDDIDEDGSPDAVVVVWSAGEGDVTLYEVARLEAEEGADGALEWVWRASTPLGDRIRIRALTLASDVLGVHLTRHGPDDEMCCPTEEVEVRFRIGERSFTEVEGTP